MSGWTLVDTVTAGIATAALAFSGYSVRTAKRVERIEQGRRHHEMTPDLTAHLQIARWDDTLFTPEDVPPHRDKLREGLQDERTMLTVRFAGPVTLDSLSVVIEVQDDQQRTRTPATRVTPEEWERTVWSRYRFQPGVDGSSADGRRTRPKQLPVGDEARYVMDRTPIPHWTTEDSWLDMLPENPRLLARVTHKQFKDPWTIPLKYETTYC